MEFKLKADITVTVDITIDATDWEQAKKMFHENLLLTAHILDRPAHNLWAGANVAVTGVRNLHDDSAPDCE